jgi:phospho-N-acetylmuramoyl-pentapeptide-transferase
MLYELLYPLREYWFAFNVTRYITFRSIMAAVTAFIISLVVGSYIIKRLKELNVWNNTRTSGCPGLYEMHKDKKAVPSMGGLIILLAIILPCLLWADLNNSFVIITLASVLWFGFLGFIDDYLKIFKPCSKGLSIATKLSGQIIIAFLVGSYIYFNPEISTRLDIPLCKNCAVNLGALYILFTMVVIVGSSNAVNFTDGLDGLAIGCVVIVAITYGAFSYVTGHARFSDYLQIMFIPQAGELAVICAAIAGAGIGFLWFNCYPASIFMGDTGSLALGGAIGTMAVFVKKELLLVLVGGIFVIEALSVLIQILSFKFRGKRVFLVAPLHHHFQLKGLSENKITIRFWLIAVILALMSLITLKLR